LKPCTGSPANYQASLWLSKANKGEDISKQMSRKQALAMAKVTRKYSKSSQKVMVAEPKGYDKSQKVTAVEPKGRGSSLTPLRNKRLATLEVKKGWEARLTKPPEEPMPRDPGTHEPLSNAEAAADDVRMQPSHPQTLQPPQPALRLKPWTDNPEAPDESCPQCSATVLPTDWLCAQCGLDRAVATDEADALPDITVVKECMETQAARHEDDDEQVQSEVAMPISLFPNGIVAMEASRHPDQGTVPRPPLKSALKGRGSTGSKPRLARATFGPNPPTVTIASWKGADLWWSAEDLAKPKRGRPPGSRNKPTRTSLTEEASEQSQPRAPERRTCTLGAVGVRSSTRPPALSQPSAPEVRNCTLATVGVATHAHTPSMVETRVEGEVHPARPPISAAERMAALRARVLAKANAGKQ